MTDHREPTRTGARTRPRRHAAAASRLLVTGVAVAGTLQMSAAMAAAAASDETPVDAPDVPAPPSTVGLVDPPPTVGPEPVPTRTVIILRRHHVPASGATSSGSGSSTRSPATPRATPRAAPRSAPAAARDATPARETRQTTAPRPATTSKGS